MDDRVALWLKRGKHALAVRGPVNRDQGKNAVEVEGGKIYHVGAKVNPREGNRWEPVVWKVEGAGTG